MTQDATAVRMAWCENPAACPSMGSRGNSGLCRRCTQLRLRRDPDGVLAEKVAAEEAAAAERAAWCRAPDACVAKRVRGRSGLCLGCAQVRALSSPDARARMAAQASAQMADPAARERASKTLLTLWARPGFAEGVRARAAALHADPAFAAAWAAGSAARMADPDFRAHVRRGWGVALVRRLGLPVLKANVDRALDLISSVGRELGADFLVQEARMRERPEVGDDRTFTPRTVRAAPMPKRLPPTVTSAQVLAALRARPGEWFTAKQLGMAAGLRDPRATGRAFRYLYQTGQIVRRPSIRVEPGYETFAGHRPDRMVEVWTYAALAEGGQ